MNSVNSDREKAREVCELSYHDWVEEYYGYRCVNCGEFIPYGCEPWAPLEDIFDDEEDQN